MPRHRIKLLVTLALGLLMAPLLAEAPPAGKVLTIGMLNISSATANARPFEVFTQALRELGYIEGQHLAIARRYADGRPERLPALAAELATLHVAVFVVTTNHTAEVVQQLTTTPIVMTTAEEPVHFGLVKSLAHPGGNITGVTVVPGTEIYGKNLELLSTVMPQGVRIGVLFDVTQSVHALWWQAMEEAARGLGMSLVPAGVRRTEDLEHALAVMKHENVTGFVILGGPLFAAQGERINALALRNGLATIWAGHLSVESGGLMAYGTNNLDRFRRAATYVDKILTGANPADLPMEQPTTFQLVINRASRDG